MRPRSAIPMLLLSFLLPLATRAQIVIPPVGDYWQCWHIHSRDVDMHVRDQVASVTVTDEIGNPCPHVVEVEYLFPVPPGAALDDMTLVVDGRELTGRILDAREARRIYEDIVRRRRDPGLVEYAGYGLYRSSAFPIPPGRRAQISVHYTTVCTKDGDRVEVTYPLSTGNFAVEPVEHFQLSLDLESSADIVSVYSPTIDPDVKRHSPGRVTASFSANHYRPVDDFQLFYETSREDVGATLMTWWPRDDEDGYYLLLVSPGPRTTSHRVIAKDVLIVLDRSGSMSGPKIRQAHEAADYVLDNLNPGDRFNVITYNHTVESLFDELRPATRKELGFARDRIRQVEARGGTNIHDALDLAMRQCRVGDRPAFVIFLTDGLPTSGPTDEGTIIRNTRARNTARARVFAFGVGYDVNVRLLDNLVRENSGRSGYVRPDENIEDKVSSLYAKIKDPVLTDLALQLEGYGTRDVTPARLGDLFEGDQLISTGRIYRDGFGGSGGGTSTLTLRGQYGGEEKCFTYPLTVAAGPQYASCRFVEKLWAVRQIGTLLDEIQLNGRVDELVEELIRLSKQYGIVTPYTSFLADERQVAQMHASPQQFMLMQRKELTAQAERITGSEAQKDAVARQQATKLRALPEASGLSPMMIGAPTADAYESGRTTAIGNIRVIGNQALYRNGDLWQTATTTDIRLGDKSLYTEIERFSDAYFELVRANTPEENRILASQQEGEKLMLRLRNHVYLIR